MSTAPVIFSHSNAYAVKPSRRNIKDDQIKACAATGGVIGLNGFPGFVSDRPQPTLDELVDHALHIAGLVGTKHLSIGLDYYEGNWPFASDEQAKALYEEWTRTGRWRPGTYPQPPWKYPEGLEVPSKLANLTAALVRSCFSEDEMSGRSWARISSASSRRSGDESVHGRRDHASRTGVQPSSRIYPMPSTWVAEDPGAGRADQWGALSAGSAAKYWRPDLGRHEVQPVRLDAKFADVKSGSAVLRYLETSSGR